MKTDHLKLWDVTLDSSNAYSPSIAILRIEESKKQSVIIRYIKFKRVMDVIVALASLIISLPLSVLLILGIKLTSRGPLFYYQERIGKNGKSFDIYKFRSMVEHAEKNGPQLSLMNDQRITSIGKFMRRFKLDEIPNFVNVLKGDMSLVGYRPERLYFIKQINNHTIKYHQLLQIKPGITSFGQIKFGYATTVEEMLERLKFDLEYMDKISIRTDLYILLKTCEIIIRGNK